MDAARFQILRQGLDLKQARRVRAAAVRTVQINKHRQRLLRLPAGSIKQIAEPVPVCGKFLLFHAVPPKCLFFMIPQAAQFWKGN